MFLQNICLKVLSLFESKGNINFIIIIARGINGENSAMKWLRARMLENNVEAEKKN